MTGDPCVIVNRTSDPLTFVADSKHYTLTPGENYGLNTGHAGFAMRQNPLMGSENYYSLEFISLVGIKGSTDYPCDPISDEAILEAMNSVERFSRKDTDLGPVKTIKKPRPTGMTTMAGANSFAVSA